MTASNHAEPSDFMELAADLFYLWILVGRTGTEDAWIRDGMLALCKSAYDYRQRVRSGEMPRPLPAKQEDGNGD